MKKLLIAFSMIGAGALIASAATDKTRTNDWFSVTTTSTIGGTFAPIGDATLDVVTGKFVIDSDLASPVTFTTATGNGLTQNLSRVSFDNLEAAVVPSSALPTGTELTTKGAKVAFAIVKGSEGNVYQAWLGDAWQTLSGTPPEETTSYTLVMDFDKRDGNKVRFSVGGEVLTAAADSASWLTYATAVENTVSVDFIGSASVGSFLGNQIEITGEVIVIPGKGEIDVRKDDVAAVEKTAEKKGYESVDAFLAADAKEAFGSDFVTNVKVAEAYALGLVTKDGNAMVPVDNGELKIAANAQANVANGIPVNLNIVPPADTDTGATIVYALQGRKSEGGWDTLVSGVTALDKLAIPTDKVTAGYRHFKVETTVTLKTLKQ